MRLPRRRGDWTAEPWRQVEYVVLDIETTGLNLKRDSVISYGAVVIRAGLIMTSAAVYSLVYPESPLSPESIAVHALRRTDLEDAPPASSAFTALSQLLSGRVLIAHAAWVESAFLSRLFKEHGSRFSSPVVDTAALARAAGIAPTGVRAEPGLEWLCSALRLPAIDPHNALGDAVTTAQIFVAIANRLEGDYPTARAFVDLTSGDSRFNLH